MRPEWRGRWASCTAAGRSSIALPKPCSACCWPPAKPESYPADLWGGPPGPRGSPWARSLLHVLRLLDQFHPPVARPSLVAIVIGHRSERARAVRRHPFRIDALLHQLVQPPPGSRDSPVKPTAAPDPAWPPRPRRLGAQGRHHRLRSEEHTSELQSLRHLVC